jgi:hypothetical protein
MGSRTVFLTSIKKVIEPIIALRKVNPAVSKQFKRAAELFHIPVVFASVFECV